MNVILFIFLMRGHDCRVNAVSPCHIGTEGLKSQSEYCVCNKLQPLRLIVRAIAEASYETAPLIATGCLFKESLRLFRKFPTSLSKYCAMSVIYSTICHYC